MKDKELVGPHYYRTLKRNMLLIMILVSFAPLLLIAGIILYEFQVSYQEKVIAHLEEVVEKHRQNIDGFLEEKLADIRVMTRTFGLEQVLLNLINNALDAMTPEGGNLEITTRVEGSQVVVDVADTGQGIPKANLARIFDPFFTTKPVGKGTGLGLSICYGIIKKMEGEISANSAVGLGTTFHVRLPLPPKDQTEEELVHQMLAQHLGRGDSTECAGFFACTLMSYTP